MVVPVIDQDRVRTLKRESESPVFINPHGPMPCKIAFECMPAPAWQVHIRGAARCIECAQLEAQTFRVLRLNPSLGALAEKTLDAVVAKAFDHELLYRIEIHGAKPLHRHCLEVDRRAWSICSGLVAASRRCARNCAPYSLQQKTEVTPGARNPGPRSVLTPSSFKMPVLRMPDRESRAIANASTRGSHTRRCDGLGVTAGRFTRQGDPRHRVSRQRRLVFYQAGQSDQRNPGRAADQARRRQKFQWLI